MELEIEEEHSFYEDMPILEAAAAAVEADDQEEASPLSSITMPRREVHQIASSTSSIMPSTLAHACFNINTTTFDNRGAFTNHSIANLLGAATTHIVSQEEMQQALQFCLQQQGNYNNVLAASAANPWNYYYSHAWDLLAQMMGQQQQQEHGSEKVPATKRRKNRLTWKGKTAEQLRQNGGKPPATLRRMVNRVEYHFSYLKTVYSLKELDDFRFEHQCDLRGARREFTNFTTVQMHCRYRWPPKKGHMPLNFCPFALMAWRPDKNQHQIHVYARNEHNHRQVPIDERVLHRRPIWPDAEPPASFITSNGRQWTFVETTQQMEKNENFVILLKTELKHKYHCIYRNMSVIEKRRPHTNFAYHLTLDCITSSNGSCAFQLLAQRTDQGRYHLFVSGQHTCLHGNGTGRDRRRKGKKKREDDEMEEEEEEEDEMEEEETEDDEEEEDEMEDDEEEDDEEDEMWDEEEEEETDEMEEEGVIQQDEGVIEDEEMKNKDVEEQGEQQENLYAEEGNANCIEEEDEVEEEKNDEKGTEGDEGRRTGCMKQQNVEEYDDNNNDGAPLAMANVNDGDETTNGGIQFIDFVDHPKSEGVKMRRLGEPKREPEVLDNIALMNEEEPICWKMKIPKHEIKEEGTPVAEGEPAGTSNSRGGQQGKPLQQQQQTNAAIGTAATPMVAINRQNQQSAAATKVVVARERWWIKENHPMAVTEPKQQQQSPLLRERKRRVKPVNYRE